MKHLQRGCCISSPLATKLFELVLLHEDITQLEQKNSGHNYNLILSWLRCSRSSPEIGVKSERQKMALALRKMLVSSKVMHQHVKLGVGLDHMYTKGWNFYTPAV